MRLLLAGVLAVVLVAATAVSASAARGMKVGFYDEALTLEYPDDFGFRTLADLGADIVRMNLYWNRVATSRPRHPRDPGDPAPAADSRSHRTFDGSATRRDHASCPG